MARVEMLGVGKELLIGRTLNTNAQWLGKRLAAIGAMLNEIVTVDDDLIEIARGLNESLARSPDFIIVVGGLGPTPDDMTLKGLAIGLGKQIRTNKEALGMIKQRYTERGLSDVELTPARRKMAKLPVGAEPVWNSVGTAPGVRLEAGRAVVFSLPGVPSEMRSIFRESVEPEIVRKVGKLQRRTVSMKLEGILESALAPIIATELRKHPGAYIKSHPKGIKNGVSRIELDIALVGGERAGVWRAVSRISTEIMEEVTATGATIISVRGLKGGAEAR